MAKPVLVACPMAKEADALRRQLAGVEVLTTGLGIKRSLPALLKVFREPKCPRILVFTGSVGQLNLDLKMGDVVLASTWCFEEGSPCFESDPELVQALEKLGWDCSARGLSLPRPVVKEAARRQQFERTGAAIYDSVTAAVLRVCQTEGVSCVTPKIVANTLESGLMAFWQRLDQNIVPLTDTLIELLPTLEELARPARTQGR